MLPCVGINAVGADVSRQENTSNKHPEDENARDADLNDMLQAAALNAWVDAHAEDSLPLQPTTV